MEALRYPDDFDGIISGAPSLHELVRGWYAAHVWLINANTGSDGKPILTAAKIPLVQKAVYAACAGEGGLVDDPRTCRFQPKDLQCHAGQGPDCLSETEIGVLDKWYGGAKTSKGEQIYPGLPLGSEPYWTFWITGKDLSDWEAKKAEFVERLRFYGFPRDPGPDYDLKDFDFDRDTKILQRAVDTNYVADGTDLAKFKSRGGKLLIYQGAADALTAPEATRQWYEDLTKVMGGESATRDFARLFMLPGMDHCGIVASPGVGTSGSSGPGVHHSGFDPLPALEKWVEEGIAPETIVMTRADKDGKVEWARPVCVYPQVARYKGSGDWKDAGNWTCTMP
jgi:feruloyl esterase